MSGIDQRTLSLSASRDWCCALARRTAGNFYYSFLALPAAKRADMCVLYAFMRVSDDLGDEPGQTPEQRAVALRDWREMLQLALHHDTADHPVFPALMDVIRRYAIPAEYFSAVIDGIEMDLQPVEFSTFAELQRYCYHVAGVVGLCCIHIWGFHDERAKASAIDCGLAFQLTNILRDLGEDSDLGRLYLPTEDLQRFGYTREDIAGRVRDERFQALMEFETRRAWDYYARAERLYGYLDVEGQPILRAMMKIYGGLLARIERLDYDVYTRRISLPRWRKLWIAFQAFTRGAQG